MANQELLAIIRQGAVEWNQWREENQVFYQIKAGYFKRYIVADLSGVNFSVVASGRRISERQIPGVRISVGQISTKRILLEPISKSIGLLTRSSLQEYFH